MLIGKTLDKRYEILECIGGGGMAEVYRAQDMLLDRPVAVKVLRSQFTGDDQFVRRFRHEAQAAARVSHPHIVNIYDVGKDGDVYYIVMEYIQGETLKEYIQRNKKLPVEEAVSIALQICEALDHAHQNNLIHCDIKPHNILMGKGGRVKVTDFGIARAVTSATLTQTGTIIGSVHYISPEQAKGGLASVHSDIYSLGVVLYEMLTGDVPFSGESPIAIALKHLQEEIVPPAQLNPDIPPMLEAVILKAVAKEPAKRYPAITSMMHDLEVVQGTLREGDTRRLAKGDFPTQILPPIGPTSKPVEQEPKPKKGRRGLWAAVLLLLLASFTVAFMVFGQFWSLEDVIVPDVAGQPVAVAQEKLIAAGLKVSIGYGYSANVPPNHVISQSPEAGSSVKQSRTINLTVSKGTEAILIPDLRGLQLRDAEIQLKNAGLALGKVDEQYTSDVPQGAVVNQNPRAASQGSKGMMVDVTVSKGPAPRKFVLPDFRGSTLASVRTQLDSLKLKLGNVQEEPNDQFPAGVIIAQNPEAGSQVEEGGTINFTVSKGVGAGLKRASVRFQVPEGAKRQDVQIVITDSNGRRTVYDDAHKPGDVIDRTVEGTGTMRIQVYINGTLYKDQTV
ncbi:MAG TPA: Stk1 family PASTA domain-containing Ser/Thr kinase [Negativicutes bacterium]|nr:Stk1 family PASTA domain-containing Ser/Thr kinase [Negativicutes bacterium]